MGAPTCAVHASESAGRRAVSSAATRRRAAARSAVDILGHDPLSNAARAAATARSTSFAWASANVIRTSSVTGEMSVSVSRELGSTHSPPMKNECGDLTVRSACACVALMLPSSRLFGTSSAHAARWSSWRTNHTDGPPCRPEEQRYFLVPGPVSRTGSDQKNARCRPLSSTKTPNAEAVAEPAWKSTGLNRFVSGKVQRAVALPTSLILRSLRMSGMSGMSGMPMALAIASFVPSRCSTHTHSSVTAFTDGSSGPVAFTVPFLVTVSFSSKLPAGISSPHSEPWALSLPELQQHRQFRPDFRGRDEISLLLVELQACGGGNSGVVCQSRVAENVREIDEGVASVDDEVGLLRELHGLTCERLGIVELTARCQDSGLDAAPQHLREQIARRSQACALLRELLCLGHAI